jgi:hypothetical protein
MREIGAVLVVIVLVLGLGLAFQGYDFFMFKLFAPKYEQVRRETFEQTKSYRQGMIQELENMRFEYFKTKDVEARKALASVILHRVSGFDLDQPDVPSDLRTFIYGLKREQTRTAP